MGFVSESIVSRNRLATVSEARATLTAALREAARMREVEAERDRMREALTKLMAFVSPLVTGNTDFSVSWRRVVREARAALKQEESRG